MKTKIVCRKDCLLGRDNRKYPFRKGNIYILNEYPSEKAYWISNNYYTTGALAIFFKTDKVAMETLKKNFLII